MRASLAARSAERISGWVIVAAGGLCGTLAFFVALPLAMSSPFPVPNQREWVSQPAPQPVAALPPAPAPASEPKPKTAYRVASLMPIPVPAREPAPPPAPTDVEALFRQTWSVLTRPWEEDGDTSPVATVPAVIVTAAPAAAPAVERVALTTPAEPEHTGSIATGAAVAHVTPAPAPAVKRPINPMDEVDQYLWDVYRRAPVKKDSSGDFTWKDPAAAKRMNLGLQDYVIRGMDRDFREQLYAAGKKMDEAGLHWSMLSAFRDNYRQQIASGFKARACNSQHGGTCATGGYGHGRAIDIMNAGGEDEAVWRWIDRNGAKYGLMRPMPGADPAHIQPRGSWHSIAVALRENRTGKPDDAAAKTKVAARNRGKGT